MKTFGPNKTFQSLLKWASFFMNFFRGLEDSYQQVAKCGYSMFFTLTLGIYFFWMSKNGFIFITSLHVSDITSAHINQHHKQVHKKL